MTWLYSAAAVLGFVTTLLYYVLLLPVLKLFDWVFLGLSPVLHLLHYVLHALYIPFSFVARFETLYIYLGVAALVGILTGSVLHFTSAILISVLGLRTPKKPVIRAPIRRRRAQAKAPARTPNQRPQINIPNGRARMQKRPLKPQQEYTGWRHNIKGQKRGGLLSQTIMEEE